ncbi:hypothetical protein AJ80_04635 [Polytolypa hystricis UAMH7299]|uniref:Clock-controlled protein 6 n=1 Tax=Polytolypa hystricis (strain UAMH7299) TaxID=1447883 RepID=A0A2B7Y1Q8_POLH7|nr:hypothetical protein AJ80_04635 [Polytolypa hystricis UAMH7299]
MRFTIAATAAFVASAAAGYAHSNGTAPPPSVVTEVVTGYTTYCPAPTTLTYGTDTITVSEPGYVTIPGEVTVTKPVYSSTVTVCQDCPPAGPTAYPTGSYPPTNPPVYPNTTQGVVPTGSQPGPSGPEFTGAASRAAVGAGAGLAGLLGLAAYLL